MRRFLITNPNVFTGEAEVVYDANCRLVKIDVSNTDMSLNMVSKFKEHIPASFVHLEGIIKNSTATIVETTMRIDFEQWWREYDKKINKKRCIPLFEKLSDSDTVFALMGIKPYKKYLKSLSYARPMADPEKYIRDRYWENEWK
jgi:hypothetical protein